MKMLNVMMRRMESSIIEMLNVMMRRMESSIIENVKCNDEENGVIYY